MCMAFERETFIVAFEWEIVFMILVFGRRRARKRIIVVMIVSTLLNGGGNSYVTECCHSVHNKCTRMIYSCFSSSKNRSVFKSAPTNSTIQQRNIKRQTFIYGPS